jgi:glycosyltransferase involved in cell wall biosynthesis
MHTPVVSIVIPARNEAVNIRRLLESLILANRRNFFLKEIVVISDGSTDDTVSKIKAIDSDLVRVIEHKENRGKIVRLNEAFKTITADILLQFDADIVLPNMDIPAQMIQPFLNQPGLAMMCGWHKPRPAAWSSRTPFASATRRAC